MTQESSFQDLNIDVDILQAIQDLGYTQPTPIQSDSIRSLSKGLDFIGQSRTGTGKTTAFAIPLIELVDPDDRRLQGVVLCPTRELCLQITEEIRKLLKYKSGIRVVPVYGGQPINYQISDLRKGCHIVVATPGRLIDHLKRHTIKLDMVQMAVLDEADEMLQMGFQDDIELILSQMPVMRQTALYSATMPDQVRLLAQKYMEDPVQIIEDEGQTLTVDPVRQFYFEVKERSKPEAVKRLLEKDRPQKALIFCNTKKRVADLEETLKKMGFEAGGLHGDLKQVQRDFILDQFRKDRIKILIATDVAARGLDISDIDLVINYDLPDEPESYVHRIGRTARAGKSGTAYTFVVGRELTHLKEIMDYTGAAIEPSRLPTLQEVQDAAKDQLMERVRSTIRQARSAGASTDAKDPLTKYRLPLEELKEEGFAPDEIAAALFKELLFVPAKEDPLSKVPTHVLKDISGKTTRLHLSLGRRQGIKVKDIIGAVVSLCGVPASSIGRIDIMETFSYIEIPSELAPDVLSMLDGATIKGKTVYVQPAQQEKTPKSRRK